MTAAALQRVDRAGAAPVAVLFVLAAAAWLLTDQRMHGMDPGPGAELGDPGWFAVSWLLMMAAMMLPALAPMVVAYRRRGSVGVSLGFAAAYLATWVVAGVVAFAGIEGIRSVGLGFLAWGEAGRYLAAGTILGAAIYQLTSPKAGCLRRCRDREQFLSDHWRPGRLDGLRMGVEYGGFCIGCCWALMAALFALGVMSLTWMAVVAVLIAAERLLPWRAHLGVALVLTALGAGLALAPDDVPGLELSSSSMETSSMEMD